MDIPSWLITLAQSLGAASAPILGIIAFLLWRDNTKLRDRLFERLDKDQEIFNKLSDSLSNVTGVFANEAQRAISDRRAKR